MYKMKSFLFAMLAVSLNACTYIDDYAFGKDNTPKPMPLPQVYQRKSIMLDWSVSLAGFKKQDFTADLTPFVSRHHVYVATPEGRVYALDKNHGQILWQKELHLTLLAGPVVSGDKILVTSDDAAIYILNRKNGDILQRVGVANDVLSKPFIHRQKAYVKTITGAVYCIDLNTGHKDWKYEHTTSEIILKASSSPVYYQNMILVGFSDGSLVGLEPTKGHPQFIQHISYARGVSEVERLTDVDTNPLIDANRLYIASYQGDIGAYSITESSFLWKKPASTYHDLSFIGDTLVMVSSKDVVWAYHKQSGQTLWTQKQLKARRLTAPVNWNQTIWVGDRLGYLHGLSPQTGQFVGQLKLPGGMSAAPVIEGKHAWVMTTNGQLHRLSLEK